jgi:tetratricopeptide (TPR) repeat protein
LQQAATIDVIVIDKDTFFGVGRATDIAPISLTQEQGVQYCELMLQTEWMTTYKPRIAAFSRAEAGIEFLAAAPTGEKADLGTFQKQAQDRARQEGKQIAFVSAPVNCNVAGFAEPVEALAVFLETDAVSSETLAVSLKAREAPVRELAYKSPSSWEIKSLLDNAEKAHRLGIIDESVKLYQQVFQKDHRDFRANIRLAQHYRSIGQVEDARMHWSLAKASDPTQAIAWALAGATYFEGYLLDQSDLADLDRAIVEFGQARQLASEAFDSLLEQHCCAMLALTLLLRNGASDVTRSKELMDEIEKWPSLSQANHVLKGLVEVSFSIAQGTPNEWNQGRERLNGLKAYLEQWGEGRHEQADVAEDNNAVLLSRGRLRILLELATFRLNAAMFLPRRPAATISQEADSSRKSSVSTRLMRDRSR